MPTELKEPPAEAFDADRCRTYLIDFADEVIRLHACGITLEEMANDIIKHEAAELSALIAAQGRAGDGNKDQMRKNFNRFMNQNDS